MTQPCNDAFIIDAVRTPIGRLGGALAGVRPDDLVAGAFAGLLQRLPDARPGTIDEVYVGDANGAGEDNRNVGAHGVPAGGSADVGSGGDGQPPVRRGMEAIIGAIAHGRRRRRRHRDGRRSREHDARAVGAAEAGEGISRPATSSCGARHSAGE